MLEPLFRTVRANHPKADLALIERAYNTAEKHHRGQMRKSGDPYITHPLAVTTILAELGMTEPTLVAALLHDTVEDTAYTLDALRTDFGDEVALLVDGVTKLDKVKYGDSAQAETIRKMIVAMSTDIRVLVIKLADRLHNMRTCATSSAETQERKARETLEIYAPLAHRLGMNTIKWELEDLAFATLYPKVYDEIVRLVAERAPARDEYLAAVIDQVEDDLRSAKIKATVTGRPKHYYSIYQKMIVRGRDFSDIYDLVGIRVLVDTVRDCYARARRAARAVEPGARPVQGLHRDAEVQHVPVAAHDGDRSRGQARRAPDPHRRHAPPRRVRRRRALEVQGGRRAPASTPSRPRRGHRHGVAAPAAGLAEGDRGPGRVPGLAAVRDQRRRGLRLHPAGDVIALPAGATPVDFAYAVHTEVGHRTIGARVNGRLVPLESDARATATSSRCSPPSRRTPGRAATG